MKRVDLLDLAMFDTFTVPVGKGKELKLEENSLIEDGILLYVSTRRAKEGRKTLNGETLANDAVVDSSFLLIKQGSSTEPIRNLPLSKLDEDKFGNTEHPGFPVYLSDVRLNQCFIQVHADAGDIVADEHFEISVTYVPNHLVHKLKK